MNDQKKGILPQNELSDELLDGVAGGQRSWLRPGTVTCDCGVKNVSNISPYIGRVCKTCGKAYDTRG